MSADVLQLIILPAGVIAVLFALYLARDVLARDAGTKEMQDVAGTIYEGAVAFIRRQYTTIGVLAVVGAVVIGGIISVFETKDVADTSTFGFSLGWRTGLAFLVGAACSMASGIIGMFISVKSNVRTAAAAR
ncbi:MAG TPA: sodium/proton-translocating pyrophosphatase, partial [Candidatus Limnocylindrales bacterium]